jgi:hypothetical protein
MERPKSVKLGLPGAGAVVGNPLMTAETKTFATVGGSAKSEPLDRLRGVSYQKHIGRNE